MGFSRSVYSVLSIALLATGCGKHHAASPEANGANTPAPTVAQKKVTKEEIEAVQYPAAVLVEGGYSKKTFGTEVQPKWRLYVCIPKTESPVTESIDLDLSELGTTLTDKSRFASEQNDAVETAITKIRILPNLKAFTETAALEAGAAGWGKIEGKISVAQVKREVVAGNPPEGFDPDALWVSSTSEFTRDSLGSGSSKWYGVEPSVTYVSKTLLRMGYLPEEKAIRTIAPCEGQDQTYVLLTGEALANDLAKSPAQ
jgi:hypothetical protein